jgi:hypothetical protein
MATIDRLEADGRFPKRIQLEPTNRVAWLRVEVTAYLRNLAKRRRPTEPKDREQIGGEAGLQGGGSLIKPTGNRKEASLDASRFYEDKSRYLNASQLMGSELDVVIDHVEVEEVGQDREEKLVLYFKNRPKGLPLNVTNYKTLASARGTETGDWVGVKVTLFQAKVEFDGKEVDAVRMRIDRSQQLPLDRRTPPKPYDVMNDEIPY